MASSHIYLSGSVTSLFILLSQSYIQYCSKISKKSVDFRYNSKVIGLVMASYLQFTGRFLIKVINSAKGALLNCSLWIDLGTLWQYGLSSFQAGGTKLERFLPKNQHTQRKLLNTDNWCKVLCS